MATKICDSKFPSGDLGVKALNALLGELTLHKYSHACPTPETQELTMRKRKLASRRSGEPKLLAKTLHDIWAWSLPVAQETGTLELLKESGCLVPQDGDSQTLVPAIRVSNLYPKPSGPNYYIHSPWPTTEVDAVFFGPDSYRYTRYLRSLTKRMPGCKIAIDMCTGAGVGAIHLAREFPDAEIFGLDINPKALYLAHVNAAHLCPDLEPRQLQMLYSDAYSAVEEHLAGRVDVITIDPPFIADDNRTYAQGGWLGIEFTLDMLRKSRPMLRSGGEAWLHMAAPITYDGRDILREELEKLEGWELSEYEVIDVDIFGNEMENPNTYPGIGNIASIGFVLKKN
ncbi:S-adenosyl-L-methionine-dependent methyltransferase [Clavulina sp. PMI_390]|nr:S-adenosyl-L-methionine-dependent methyltransferase [Clavulina sp. PMI_390]